MPNSASVQPTCATHGDGDGAVGTVTPSPYVPFASYPDMNSTSQAAEALGTNEKTLRELIRRSDLFAVRMGRVFRIPKQSLIDFSEGKTHGGGA
ncbi:helix-turn-helix domain-containing protein [Olsenella sp. Marseille-P4559]|uniref:helix-turn-helix domain-containing protein n=1 Tax=Olsenella sp. Marseille-P4559 TaxID=2364795 RepID=UPI0013EF01FC|nr:helix-turn-helix domain-containing protein [Olsenella sp. Marseille-P4559]